MPANGDQLSPNFRGDEVVRDVDVKYSDGWSPFSVIKPR